jgi:hypothetical protein
MVEEAAHLMAARKQGKGETERQERARKSCSSQGHDSSDLIPSTRPHQQQFLASPKIVPPSGD